MRKRCLLTGGSGLVGKQLTKLLLPDWQVFQLGRHLPQSPLVEHLNCDLNSEWSTDGFPDKLDAVIHLAQSNDYRLFPEKAEDIFRVNTTSTVRLLDYARRSGARTFVLASSGGVYGLSNEPFCEADKVALNSQLSFYQYTKLCSEALVQNYHQYFDIMVIRFFFVYGPHQKRTMLIPRLIHSIQQGKPIDLQGENGISINPIYVSDAAMAVRKSLELSESHCFNVGGSEVLSIKEIAEIVGAHLGKIPEYRVLDSIETSHLIGNITKMKQLLHTPSVSFENGVLSCLDRGEVYDEYKDKF